MMNLFFRKRDTKKVQKEEGTVKVLNGLSFESEILEKKGTSLVEFYADWCAPCKLVDPVLEQIARDRIDITVGKVNVEKETVLTSTYGIISVPTLIVFKEGKVCKRMVGARSKGDILAVL